MRPRERRESGEQDLFRSRLDQVINMDHALVKLARTIDWRFLEEKFGAVYNDGPGQPPLPKRLMAGLAILKHTYNHSDEIVCELWIENRYYQYFCGAEFFQHRLPLDRSSMSNWRNRMGEERLQALLQDAAPPSSPSSAISRKISPNGPQLSRPPPRRLQQRHPRRRRLQLPPPHQVAQDSIAPLPGRALRSAKYPGRLKRLFFADD
jgi:hypothetical protein